MHPHPSTEPNRTPTEPRPPAIRRGGEGRASCQLALAIASAAFDVAPEEIDAPQRRAAEVADARHVAMYLAHVVFQISMQRVADGFGRDRTSVGHAVRRVEDRRDEPRFDRQMERLERLAAFCRRGAGGEGR